MAVYTRQYTQGVGWENEPSINTPISAENLNQMDNAALDIDAAVKSAFDSVETSLANAGGVSMGNKITSFSTTYNSMETDIVFDDSITNHDGAVFFLTSDTSGAENQNGWKIRVNWVNGSSTTVSRLFVFNISPQTMSDFFTDAVAEGDVVIARLVIEDPADSGTWHCDLLAHISASANGGGAAYGNYIETIDRSPYFSLNTDISFSGSITAHDGEVFFLTSKAASSVNPNGWRVKMDWVDGSTSTYTRLLLMDINAETVSDVFTASVAEDDILVVKLVIDDPSDVNTWKCDLLARIRPSGGGGGTTVVANPSGTATDTLVKLQVGSTIYEIPGIDTAWAGKVTAVSGGNITPNNASFSFDPFTAGQFIILEIGVNAVMPSGVTSWSLQYTVDGNTVTRGIVDKRDGNAYDPDFDDNLVSGSVIVLQYIGNNSFACLAVLDQNGGGGASTLADLTDTNIIAPSDGQLLTYDSTSGKWINASAGGGTGVLTYEIVTKSTGGTNAAVTVNKYVNKSRKSSTDYLYTQAQTPVTIDDKITLDYGVTASGKWTYTLLEASEDHAVGYSDSWSYSSAVDKTEDYESQENPDVLDALDDVNLTLPFGSGQPITFDATSGKWANGGVIPIANGGTGNAEGYIQTGIKSNTTAAVRATIEGIDNTGGGVNSHVEGISNTISVGGSQAHAEGGQNTASAANTHVEGGGNKATSAQAHAEGYGTTASGQNSHTQNTSTTASGASASASGSYTTAGYASQFVVGKYNNNKSTNIFEVGIGANANAKANGLELDTSGNLKVAGTITDGNGNVLNKYLETTVTLSTSAQTTATFTDAVFTTTTCVDVAVSEWGLVPDDVTVTTGSCTVTFPIVDTARTVSVRVYVR